MSANGARPEPAPDGGPDLRPRAPDAPVAQHDSGVIQGVERTTNPTTGQQDYRTEFVRVYQDAGVVGVSMITLLVLCLLLGIFCLRLLKMYVTLTESRDKLESARSAVNERIAERLLAMTADMNKLSDDHAADKTDQAKLNSKVNRILEKVEKIEARP